MLFPIVVVAIVSWHLNPNIRLSPLMVLGTQWYILFNVIAGASAFPTDLREASTLFGFAPGNGGAKSSCPGYFPTMQPEPDGIRRLLEREHRGGSRQLG